MKKLFITAMAVIFAVLSVPIFTVFADNEELADIPVLGYSDSGRAYCLYEEKDGEHTLTYVNCKTTKLLYKSKEKFKYNYSSSISEDGKTVFYSVNNTVYRYSYESGKRKKIYSNENPRHNRPLTYVCSSPNGEYCAIHIEYSMYDDVDIILWHNGKTVSQSEETVFDYVDGDNFYGVNDMGEAFYTLDRDIYVLDLNGKRLVEKAPEFPSEEDCEVNVFTKSRTYFTETKNAAFYGEIGGERHELSFDKWYYIMYKSGERFMAYNGEHVSVYDIKSGKSRNILKISPQKYEKSYRYKFAASGGLNEIVYINSSKKKLVRLSDWDAEKNHYTNRQEIKIFGTGTEEIHRRSDDLNIVGLAYADDQKGNYFADFNSGRLIPAELGNKTRLDYEIDRFNNIMRKRGEKIESTDLNGNTTTIFDGVGASCEPWFSNGFYCFYSGGPETEEYEGVYDLIYYYIDENGKAVKWYDDTDVYMERHYLEDWGE